MEGGGVPTALSRIDVGSCYFIPSLTYFHTGMNESCIYIYTGLHMGRTGQHFDLFDLTFDKE